MEKLAYLNASLAQLERLAIKEDFLHFKEDAQLVSTAQIHKIPMSNKLAQRAHSVLKVFLFSQNVHHNIISHKSISQSV